VNADLKIDDSSRTAKLKLGGKLLIQDTDRLKDVLVRILKEADNCVLDLEEVKVFDLSSIQLFYAFHLAARQQEMKFSLKADCPQRFKEAVESAGLAWTKWLCFGEV
jgi:anti-anti-sigma regulatory factor